MGSGAKRFGVGFDLPWGSQGFVTTPGRGEHSSDRVASYLAGGWDHGHDAVFGSFQLKGRAWLDARDYLQAWDDFAARTEGFAIRTLHHTLLNLGALEHYDRGRILALTNALIDRHGFAWVNEDLGLWSLRGHPLAYPLPPLLTESGLAAAIRNVEQVAAGLHAPLLVEFPGFSEGASLVIGRIDAYDFLARLATATGTGVTLDIGHLLSWRWLCGWRGPALFDELDRLPLAHCVEIHLSGCSILGDRFYDDHRGVLLAEQFELLERLLPVCPGLRVVTYEDPALAEDGSLAPECVASHARLRAIVEAWRDRELSTESVPAAALAEQAVELDSGLRDPTAGQLERLLLAGESRPGAGAAELASALAIRELLITELIQRSHRGCGSLLDRFARTISAWRDRHPDDRDLRELFAAFLGSREYAEQRELPFAGLGTCLEDAFGRFAATIELGPAEVREAEHLAAVILALVVDRDPAFEPPSFVRRAPRGWYALSQTEPAVLYAALDDRYVTGPLTPLLSELLRRPEHDLESPARSAAREALVSLGLLEGHRFQ